MNKLKVLGAVTMLGLMLALTASAAEFNLAHEKNDTAVNVPSSETHKNLYAAGATVTIDGATQGDLFAAGATVTLNGKVENDLFVAGGNLSINSPVGNNSRIAGGNISINAPVTTDLLVAGGTVSVSEKATVGGDLVAAGGSITVNSEVKGKATLRGGDVTINGKVDGDLLVQASKSLTFGPNSVVTGVITYEGPSAATIQDGAKVSTVNFTQTTPHNFGGDLAKFLVIATLIKMLGLFIGAWVINRLFPGKFGNFSNAANAKPWHNLGIGVIALIATPIIAVLLMITVLGFYIGLALMAMYALVLLMAAFMLPYFVGSMLVAWYKKTSNLVMSWQALVYGIIAMTIASLIPFIGWLAVGIVYTICIGALVIHVVKTETSVTL